MKWVRNKLALAIHGAAVFGLLVHQAALADTPDASASTHAGSFGGAGNEDMDGYKASQATAKSLQAVQVTGTHIAGVDVASGAPVTTITSKQIKATGMTTVQQVLQRLPQMGTSGSGFTPQDALGSDPGVGGQFANLRNLGPQRTLVLVNGKRWSTGLQGTTDLSTIPVSLIDHIDVLTDGASSIYGSDAIAGVVNIVLKDHLEGGEVSTYYGQNPKGGGGNQDYNFSFGHSTKRNSFMVAGEVNHVDPVWDHTYAVSRYPQGQRHPEDNWGSGGWGQVTDPASGMDFVHDHDGGRDLGPSNDRSSYHPRAAGNVGDKYNTNKVTTFQSSQSLKNIFVNDRYQITDNLAAHFLGDYSKRSQWQQMGGYPLTSDSLATSAYPDGISISGQNAYNPYPGQDVSFARRGVEMPRRTHNVDNMYHFEFGLDGAFTLLKHDWTWDASYSYTKERQQSYDGGNYYLPHLAKSLGPAAGCTGSCIPWDILGGPGTLTPAVQRYVGYSSEQRYVDKQDDFTLNTSGGLFDWWAGTVSLAMGYEHRGIKGSYHPDGNDTAGLTSNPSSGATRGRYNTNEVYGELDIPLLKDLPGAKEFAVNVASRYVHYSNFGSNTSNKYNFRWRPIDDLLVRGTYAKGFRAPSLWDMYQPASQSFETYLDPCDSLYGSAHGSARCGRDVPAGFRQKDQTGNAIINGSGGQTPNAFTQGGNPKLKPEKSTTKTLGLVYSPHFIDGLTLNVDWYQIRITNVITSLLASNELNYCYVYNDPGYCNDFTRAASGQVDSLHEGPANLGWMKTQGYDFGFSYQLPSTRFGTFVINSNNTWQTKYDESLGPGRPVSHWNGYLRNEDGIFRFRSTTNLTWNYKAFSATWTVRYYSGLADRCYAPGVECNHPNFSPSWWPNGAGSDHKGSVTFNDISAAYTAPWQGTFQLGVNNVFDRKGPTYYGVASYGGGSPPHLPQFDYTRYAFFSYTQKFN